MEKETISVVGIGKLGLCTAACFAAKGYKVIGVDLNQNTIQAINEGMSPIYEPGLDDLIKSSQGRLSATSDYEYAIKNSEVTFIIVPTPSDGAGGFSTRYVEAAVKSIAELLRSKDAFHIVVLTSTVLPGATEGIVKQLLEGVSGKKCGKDFGLCYNPEFIALGSVIHDFTHPDVVLIGESDSKSGELLADIYRNVCESQPPIVRTTICNAELAKISLNAFITMKITFANTLAEIAEKIPSGDVDVVSQMLGFDSRIGRKYLTGGTAYGGPCFPRDNKAFATFARQVGCEVRLSEAADEVNKHQNERIVELVKQRIGKVEGMNIAILGLTYKPNTDVIEEAAAIKIASALLQEGAKLQVYDPAGMENACEVLGEANIEYAGSVKECLKDAEFCIIATPWDEFRNLKPEDFTQNMKRPVLLDCWRILRQFEFSDELDYFALGLNPSG